MSVLAVGTLSRNAAAASADHYGWNGYQGNAAIYMTTGLTDLTKPYLIGDSSASFDQNTNTPDHNAIKVISGGGQYVAQGQVFDEYYKPDTAELIVDVPIVAAGAGDVYQNGYYFYAIANQKLSLSLGGVPASPSVTANAGFDVPYNSGYNVTGQLQTGTTRDQALYQLAQDAAGFLPTVGFPIGIQGLVRDGEQLSGVDSYNLGVTGPGTIYEYFTVHGGGRTQNVFTSNAYVTVHIPSSLFTTYLPTIGVTGENVIGQISSGSNYVYLIDGATASYTISAVPAVTLSGTISAYGSPFANEDISLVTYDRAADLYTTYHLKTDQNGQYRFFAQLNKQYSLSVASPPGQKSFATLKTPSPQTVDLTIGGFTRITNTLAPSTAPAVAVDSSGNYHLAWAENGKEIHYAKVDPNRNILVPDTRLTTSYGSIASPAIAVSSTGTVVVMWSDSRAGNYEIYWKKYTTSWGADQVKTATIGDAKEPSVVIDSSGYVRFVYRTLCRPAWWNSCTAEEERIKYAFDNGNPYGPTFTELFYYAGAALTQAHNDRLCTPRIAMGTSGQMHVGFSQGPAYQLEFTPTTIYYVRYSGSAWTSPVKVGSSQDTVRRTAIAADTGNMVYVAWETWGNGFDIYLTKSANGGVAWPTNPPTSKFGADVSSYQFAPDLAIGPGQVVYVSWSDNRDGQYEIYYSYSTNLGGTWSPPIRVTNAPANSLYARMAVSPSSGLVGFVWQDYRNSVNNDGNWEVYFAS